MSSSLSVCIPLGTITYSNFTQNITVFHSYPWYLITSANQTCAMDQISLLISCLQRREMCSYLMNIPYYQETICHYIENTYFFAMKPELIWHCIWISVIFICSSYTCLCTLPLCLIALQTNIRFQKKKKRYTVHTLDMLDVLLFTRRTYIP